MEDRAKTESKRKSALLSWVDNVVSDRVLVGLVTLSTKNSLLAATTKRRPSSTVLRDIDLQG